ARSAAAHRRGQDLHLVHQAGGLVQDPRAIRRIRSAACGDTGSRHPAPPHRARTHATGLLCDLPTELSPVWAACRPKAPVLAVDITTSPAAAITSLEGRAGRGPGQSRTPS